ncbi:hypothetical protein C8J55DRAFT_492274 [Lentinula edodes]|uniref:PWWP domain-containing protein n=1 Tax=Lentinula lateritia TaxID=40482 RepID=A0A9W8ZWV5_9AGAR|nr:hypothetical protein C8J55DRAFT_492274 [Lentinula edodes]
MFVQGQLVLVRDGQHPLWPAIVKRIASDGQVSAEIIWGKDNYEYTFAPTRDNLKTLTEEKIEKMLKAKATTNKARDKKRDLITARKYLHETSGTVNATGEVKASLKVNTKVNGGGDIEADGFKYTKGVDEANSYELKNVATGLSKKGRTELSTGHAAQSNVGRVVEENGHGQEDIVTGISTKGGTELSTVHATKLDAGRDNNDISPVVEEANSHGLEDIATGLSTKGRADLSTTHAGQSNVGRVVEENGHELEDVVAGFSTKGGTELSTVRASELDAGRDNNDISPVVEEANSHGLEDIATGLSTKGRADLSTTHAGQSNVGRVVEENGHELEDVVAGFSTKGGTELSTVRATELDAGRDNNNVSLIRPPLSQIAENSRSLSDSDLRDDPAQKNKRRKLESRVKDEPVIELHRATRRCNAPREIEPPLQRYKSTPELDLSIPHVKFFYDEIKQRGDLAEFLRCRTYDSHNQSLEEALVVDRFLMEVVRRTEEVLYLGRKIHADERNILIGHSSSWVFRARERLSTENGGNKSAPGTRRKRRDIGIRRIGEEKDTEYDNEDVNQS